jgi:hypothetical protein
MIAIFEILPVCRAATIATSMAVEGIGDDRTAPLGRNRVEGRRELLFCFAMQSAHARRKKAGHGCCGKTIEAQPLSDQTCHIEDVLAATCQSIREGFRKWRNFG